MGLWGRLGVLIISLLISACGAAPVASPTPNTQVTIEAAVRATQAEIPTPTFTPTPSPSATPTTPPVPTAVPTATQVSAAAAFRIDIPTGITVTQTPYVISGVGLPGMEITQDISMSPDQHVTVDQNGNWSMSVDLEPGDNELTFREETTGVELIVHINYAPPTPTPEPPTATPVPSTSTPVPVKAQPGPRLYAVTSVVDGDTIKIRYGDHTETLRLIGMDTPETKDPRKPVQCFGAEASKRAKQLLSGKRVRIADDPTQDTRDKYGRLLVYVWLENGTMYNRYMIAQGYAHEYTYDVPYQYQADFKAAERTAREKQLGLWSPTTCNGDTTQPAATATPLPRATATPVPRATATPPPSSGNCDPSYPDVCIPPAPPDLDCGDYPVSQYSGFRVLPPDPHRLDGNKDGIGCEGN